MRPDFLFLDCPRSNGFPNIPLSPPLSPLKGSAHWRIQNPQSAYTFSKSKQGPSTRAMPTPPKTTRLTAI